MIAKETKVIVKEVGDNSEDMIDTDRPVTRSQWIPGLSTIRQPPGSHRNKFEEEFQQETRESFRERQSHVMVGDNSNGK